MPKMAILLALRAFSFFCNSPFKLLQAYVNTSHVANIGGKLSTVFYERYR